MNYTQQELDQALKYAALGIASGLRGVILAAEVRRLQKQYEMDRLGMSDAMAAIDLRDAAISERDGIIAQLRADLAARDALCAELREGANRFRFIVEHMSAQWREELSSNIEQARRDVDQARKEEEK